MVWPQIFGAHGHSYPVLAVPVTIAPGAEVVLQAEAGPSDHPI